MSYIPKFKRIFSYISNHESIVLVFIIALGLALRLFRLVEPFWGDEILSLDIATHFKTIGEIITYLQTIEVHPPLYYILIHFWVELFGKSELIVRLPSLFFGLGVIYLSFVLAKKILPKLPQVGLWTAFIVAILPIQINYSQSARPYIIVNFFALLALLGLWQWLNKKNYGYFLLFILSSTIGLYLHYSYLFYWATFAIIWAIWLVVKKENYFKAWRDWLVAQAAIFIGFYWWLDVFLYKTVFLPRLEIFGLIHSRGVFPQPVHFFEQVGHQFIWLSYLLPVSALEVAGIVIFKILLVAAVIWLESKKAFDYIKEPVLFVMCLVLTCIFLFMFSAASTPYTNVPAQHVIMVSVLISVLLAVCISLVPVKIRFVLVSIFIASLLNSISVAASDATKWDSQHRLLFVADYINSNYKPGDLVLVISFLRSDLNYYLNPEIPTMSLDPAGYFGIDFMRSRQTLGLIENESQFRIKRLNIAETFIKLDTIDKLYKPSRIWLAYPQLTTSESDTFWFYSRQWITRLQSSGPLFPVHLFERPSETK